MARVLAIDFETYSAADLPRVGADAYAAHESTGVHCAVMRFSDGGARMVWTPGSDVPAGAVRHFTAGGVIVAHNAGFERAILRHVLVPAHGWPESRSDQWIDTMDLAAAANLPLSLEMIAKTLGTTAQKDMEGAALMKRVMVAEQHPEGGWTVPTMTAEDRARLIEYCDIDVVTTLAVLARIPKPTPTELAVMRVDRRINERGVHVDLTLARKIDAIATRRGEELEDLVFSESLELTSTSNVNALKVWLESQGVTIPEVKRASKGKTTKRQSLDRDAVRKLLEDSTLSPAVRAVLQARIEAGRVTSLAKVDRLQQQVGADGRLRGMLAYSRAHTGRWTSHGVQLHNLPKPEKEFPRDAFIDAILRADFDAARELWPIMDGLSFSLRSLFCAAPGCRIIGADYSSIEARGIAWLAGETDALAALSDPKRDIYVEDAAAVGSDSRPLGKVCRLGLGYGMGAVKFLGTAAAAKPTPIYLEPKRAREIVRQWRDANPNIVAFWSNLEGACRDAMQSPGTVFPAGRVSVFCRPGALYIQLPSGRRLTYWRPHTRTATRRFEVMRDDGTIEIVERTVQELRFYRPGGRGMECETTYGGKLTENVTQAVCRDLLAEALIRLEGTAYNTVLHVHDAIAAEVSDARCSVDEFVRLMTTRPMWADGFPVAAEGYESARFKG